MSKQTSNKFSPEVRSWAVRLVVEHEHEHPSRWTAIMSIAAKIGCTPQTLLDWVKKAEVDSGKRARVPTDMAEKLKAWERENRDPGGARPPSEAMIALIDDHREAYGIAETIRVH